MKMTKKENKSNSNKELTPQEILFEKEYQEFIIRVGLKIGYYRRAANMTQLELSEAAKISHVFLTQLEGKNFDYSPSLKTLWKISKALGIKTYKLIDVQDD